MSRPPTTSRKVGRVLVLLALFLVCLRTTQTTRAFLGAGAVQFPRLVPPGIWARNLLVARRAEAEGNEDEKASEKDQDEVEGATTEAKPSFDQAEDKTVEEAASAQTAGPIKYATKDEQLQTNEEDLARRVQEVAIKQLETAQQAVTTAQQAVTTAQQAVTTAQEVVGRLTTLWLAELPSGSEKANLLKQELNEAQQNYGMAQQKYAEAQQKYEEAQQNCKAASASIQAGRVQAIKTVSEKDLQNLANISGPKVTIEDWMVGLDICGKKCVKHIQTFAPKSDSDTERVPPLMLSRCMRGGKTTFLAYLFKLVKAETSYLPIFISFNGLSGIQQKKGESRLQTILRAIAVTLLQPSISTDAQSVSVNEDTLREHLERQDGVIVLMIDELNLLVPKGTADNEVASFLQRHFLSRANRYLVFTTHEPFDGSRVAEYTGGKLPYSPRDVIATDLPRSIDVTEQRRIPECRALSVGNVLFFSGIPALLRSWKQQYNFQARFEQLPKPKKTPDLLESFVREFLDGRRQGGDAIRAFDCLTATSDKADVKWILCYAAQMCSYLNQHQLADWINRLQIDASDPLSGKGWEVLVVLAAAFRCLNAMACGEGHGLLGLPPDPNIKACYFLDVPSEVSTYKEALEWWARQDIPPTFPFVAVLNPLCSTFEVFDCILLYQRSKLRVIQVRGFQQKAGCTYPDGAACQGVDCVWMQGKAAEHRRSEQANGWTLPSAGEIRAFLGASLRDLFPKELDT